MGMVYTILVRGEESEAKDLKNSLERLTGNTIPFTGRCECGTVIQSDLPLQSISCLECGEKVSLWV